MSYKDDSETHKNLSHRKSVLQKESPRKFFVILDFCNNISVTEDLVTKVFGGLYSFAAYDMPTKEGPMF